MTDAVVWPPPRLKRSDTFVYFILNRVHSQVKIGHTKQPKKRINNIRNQAGIELEILAVISETDEFYEELAHRQASGLRMIGEWFEATPELLTWIDELVIQYGSEDAA